MEKLNFRFQKVKEKLDDISGDLDELTNIKTTRINNLSTIHYKKTNEKLLTQPSLFNTNLDESGLTFSRKSSINKLFTNQLSRRTNLKQTCNDTLEFKQKKPNMSNYINITTNTCLNTQETHVETLKEEETINNYYTKSQLKKLKFLNEEDEIISQKWEKIYELEAQIKDIYKIIYELEKKKIIKNKHFPKIQSIQNTKSISKEQNNLRGIENEKIEDLERKSKNYIKFYDQLKKLYDKYSDTDIYYFNLDDLYKWISKIIEKNFSENDKIREINNKMYRDICENLLKEYKLNDASDLRKFINDLLEKNNINKKRVDTIKKLLMKESKLRKDK